MSDKFPSSWVEKFGVPLSVMEGEIEEMSDVIDIINHALALLSDAECIKDAVIKNQLINRAKFALVEVKRKSK